MKAKINPNKQNGDVAAAVGCVLLEEQGFELVLEVFIGDPGAWRDAVGFCDGGVVLVGVLRAILNLRVVGRG